MGRRTIAPARLASEVMLLAHSLLFVAALAQAAPAGDCAALVVGRNAGTNPQSYTAAPPLLGSTFIATVDLTTTGHTNAMLFGFDTPVEIPLNGGQVLLAFDGGSGELTGTPIVHGPISEMEVPIPADPGLCGLWVRTQALHFSGVFPFALSNAQDLRLGVP